MIPAWNAIAVSTIAGPAPNGAGKANAEAFLWFAFVQAAVYNAVNGITGEYELYEWKPRRRRRASPQAAAAAAAHGVLMEYFGSGEFANSATIAANLNAALATSLEQIPDGVSKDQGVRYGERAAEAARRASGGRRSVRPDRLRHAPAAGVWRPTPPAMAPFFDPWLGQVEPLVLDSPSQFRPGPPPADLVGAVRRGVRGGPRLRREHGFPPNRCQTRDRAVLLRYRVSARSRRTPRPRDAPRRWTISDSARLFAAVDLSMADAAIAVWDGKFHYGWWRPITAIREAETDGNPNTAGVPGWTPLIVTPPYPDWPSGLNGVIGAASTALSQLNADGLVDLNITSAAAGVTRHYDIAADIQQDAIDARVYSGIHFRTADEVAIAMGAQVANWALDHHFAPAK